MRYYAVIREGLYNERKRRVLHPGEVIDFDSEQGELLTARGFLVEIGEREYKRRSAPRYKPQGDPELDKLSYLEV